MNIISYSKFITESNIDSQDYYSFDWDDNLLHMPTVIHMDKLIDGEWSPIDVSTSEFAIFRNDSINYRLINSNPSEAFCEFRDTGPRGSRSFLIDTKNAISNKYFGPSWEQFIKCLTEGSIFSIITARGHEPNTIKNGVKYIIDKYLSDDDKYLMYNNCLKHSYRFSSKKEYDRFSKVELSKSELIIKYLNSCDFYGVSSDTFINEFGEGSASNPEHAKQLALDKFIEKCNNFGRRIGAKSVSIGFSDDDSKNIEHVRKFFKEKSSLENEFDHKLKLSLFKTSNRNIKGGEVTKFHEAADSLVAAGMASSVMPFAQYNNISNLFDNGANNDPIATRNIKITREIAKKTKDWIKPSDKKKIKRKKIKKTRLI